MAKERGLKVIVTFPNTTTALAMEAACKEANVPGRIIPVPNKIYAGCGFSWCADAEEKDAIQSFIAQKELTYSEVHLIEM